MFMRVVKKTYLKEAFFFLRMFALHRMKTYGYTRKQMFNFYKNLVHKCASKPHGLNDRKSQTREFLLFFIICTFTNWKIHEALRTERPHVAF